jgi:hypothetical protein
MIDKTLSGLFRVVTEEAAHNPAFAQKLEDALGEFSEAWVERRKAERSVADFHPFIEFRKDTPEAFRRRLDGFGPGELRLIVEKHGLDPARTLKPKAAKKAVVELIFTAAEKRAARDAKLFEY